MLLDDDVVTDGKTQSSSFASRFGRKERAEQFLPQLWGYARAIIAYSDFHLVAEALGRRSQRRS